MYKTIVTSFLLLFFGVLTPLQSQTYISSIDAKSDALKLQEKLILVHPAVDSTNMDRIRFQFDTLIENLPKQINIDAFYAQLAGIVNPILCGHTYIKPPRLPKTSKNTSFSIPFEYIEGKMISKGEDPFKNPTAFELVSVDKIPIDTILNKLMLYQSGSDENLYESKNKVNIARFSGVYSLFFPSKKSYNYQIKDINSDFRISTVFENSATLKRIKRVPFCYKFDEINKIGELDLNSFTGFDPYQLIYRHKISQIFKEIKKQKVEKLIIDVRGNGGGTVPNLNLILRYLLSENFILFQETSGKRSSLKNVSLYNCLKLPFGKRDEEKLYLNRFSKEKSPKKKNRFDGELIILVDELTFSAASLFASLIKFNDRGTLIGTVAGGNFDHTYGGYFEYFELKKSGIRLRFPLFKVVLDVDDQMQEKGTNLLPDIYLEQTIEDYVKGKDTVLEKAYEMLK